MANGENPELDLTLARARELMAHGRSPTEAWGIAEREARLRTWPTEWGDDFKVILYGDFQPPSSDAHFPALGITVHSERVTNTAVHGALAQVRATITLKEKSSIGIEDAVQRLNTLLGAWTLVGWGNFAVHYWCHFTHSTMGGLLGQLEQDATEVAASGVLNLEPRVRRKVQAALFWIRDPVLPMMQSVRSDLLAKYAGHWNAFECLIDAVNIAVPRHKLTSLEKEDAIAKHIASCGGRVTVAVVQELYRTIVDTGLRGRARSALTTVFGAVVAERYMEECFHRRPKSHRLYQIRNDIDHGNVDFTSHEASLLIEDRLHRLKLLLWGMFGRLIPFSYPVDPQIAT